MSFQQKMNEWQVAWRKGNVTSNEFGLQNGKRYEWILPSRLWEEGLWPGIRSGSPDSLPEYLDEFQIQKHAGVHNLKSSWVLCANLYFPFRRSTQARDLLAGFLRERVHPDIRSVDAVELEYAEDGDLNPSALLGEAGGKRGAGQTSPDVAFLVNDRSGLVLTENKFVEHSFYRCSARRRESSLDKPGNPNPTRCLQNALVIAQNQRAQCHQAYWGRRYWEILVPSADGQATSSLHNCPAAFGGYQLFRQQALAEGIAASPKYDLVVSCLAIDERNTTLRACLKSTGIQDIKDWGSLFNGRAKFAVFTHQEWVDWVRKNDCSGQWQGWLAYVARRYGFAPARASELEDS